MPSSLVARVGTVLRMKGYDCDSLTPWNSLSVKARGPLPEGDLQVPSSPYSALGHGPWSLRDAALSPELSAVVPAEMNWELVFRGGGVGGLVLLGQVSSPGKSRERGGQPDHPPGDLRGPAVLLDAAQCSTWEPQARQTGGPPFSEPGAAQAWGLPDVECGLQACPFSTPSF